MGNTLTPIRWTPSSFSSIDASTERRQQQQQQQQQQRYRQSKSFPPAASSASPGNSTATLSHDGSASTDHEAYYYDRDHAYASELAQHGGGGSSSNTEHVGTSGILMGINAPQLYDACLVGRWDDVLRICSEVGKRATTTTSTSTAREEEVDRESHATEETLATIMTSPSSVGDEEFVSCVGPADADLRNSTTVSDTSDPGDDTHENEEELDFDHPTMQIRYADHRRNTAIHLACRRQPPPLVIRALLDCSPPRDAIASRRTADGLTPLHFAAYCGAGPEVVGMLVDRMRSDAAIMKQSTRGRQSLGGVAVMPLNDTGGGGGGGEVGVVDIGVVSEKDDLDNLVETPSILPPTRILDRRRRTPLHCALSGFRTPIRPTVVRKLLSVDPVSSILGDERGRTPISLLFDDYAEEVMEALDDDITPIEVSDRCTTPGAELHECWEMLSDLLRAAYLGGAGVSKEKDVDNDSSSSSSLPDPQDNRTGEINVMEINDRHRFSIVHAAAGVWECPAPLTRLILKCLCGVGLNNEWITQPDEESRRLPLHIAVCARPSCREGYTARLKAWLSSSAMMPEASSRRISRRPSQSSIGGSRLIGSLDDESIYTQSSRGRSTTAAEDVDAVGQVYNRRFGRSPSRDNVANTAYSSSLRGQETGSSYGVASGSPLSVIFAREPFMQQTIVRDLLDLYPEAASVVDGRTGKLPIVLAIENGKPWDTAVAPLLEAYPKHFGGGGDGGMALPDFSPEGQMHRASLQGSLFLALNSHDILTRAESMRTAGKLAEWGGVFAMPGALDGIISSWLDAMINRGPSSASDSLEGVIVGPGDWIQIQSSLLNAVSEIVAHSRPDSISDRVARLCLNTSREYLFSKDDSVREAAACVLGNTLDVVGDAEDAFNIMKEVVLNMTSDEHSICSSASTIRGGGHAEDLISKHGRLLACKSILSTQWGSELLLNQEIHNATIALIFASVNDNNIVVRCSAYHAIGPILGKSNFDANTTTTPKSIIMKELRGIILKATRASEKVDVQLALARGLTWSARIHPTLFLCKPGMPIMDAALMLAMSSSSSRSPNVQKAFQIFLWVALGGQPGHDDEETQIDIFASGQVNPMSPGLQKYIQLAEGENGMIMMKFVTQTLLKVEHLNQESVLY